MAHPSLSQTHSYPLCLGGSSPGLPLEQTALRSACSSPAEVLVASEVSGLAPLVKALLVSGVASWNGASFDHGQGEGLHTLEIEPPFCFIGLFRDSHV